MTTRQIAEAAGVAEGTIFRVFETKDALVDAAVAQAFSPGLLPRRLAEIDTDLDFRDRMVQLVSVLQQRFRATFELMGQVGLVRPPDHLHDGVAARDWRTELEAMLVMLVGADSAELAVPVEEFVHTLRLLTFAGSHPHISDGRLLSPDQIVDTVLDGMRRRV